MNELEEIMSGADLAPEAAPIQQEPAPQPRDDSGRFASQQVEQPVTIEAPAAEAQPAAEQAAPSGGNVPVGAVQDERQKRQAAQQRADDLEKQLAVMQGQISLLTQQRQPAQQPQQEQQPVSIFENPDEYLKSQLTPVQQQVQEMREMIWEGQAAQTHGMEALEAAKKAAEALFGKPEGHELHRRLTSGGNPFDHLVKWHKQQQAFAKVGDDPDAWLGAEIEKRLSDPAFLAQAIERARTGVAANPAARSQPVTQIPPSLNRLPAGGNQPADTDMSDGALFSHATR